ncbi:redoxin domain-containing protein, partial [Flavihumibacter sp. CACIAM 22H1]|uniref:redoxin domain-containing protein n=1 Tax=Flavihumibacter sp. CACIAM 22H1 TaxID=1812911 RepID=UPI0025C4F7C5
KQLEDSLQLLTAKGATILAVSPEIQENIAKTIAKTKASFPVLHDAQLKIMKAYDVAYDVDPETIERYKKFKIDFNAVNGSNGAKLPVPAVYIIKNGVISYRFFNEDYTKRPSVRELAEQL